VTLGVEVDGVIKAYPFSELGKASSSLRDIVNGIPLMIYFDMETLSS